jgi:hypothetical protein
MSAIKNGSGLYLIPLSIHSFKVFEKVNYLLHSDFTMIKSGSIR